MAHSNETGGVASRREFLKNTGRIVAAGALTGAIAPSL
ncbi:MAG: twin-arginine translocation signal domain-containing protein, partial [Acidobacteriota bacterium]